MEYTNHFKNFGRAVAGYFYEIDGTLFATVVAVLFLSILNLYGIGGSEGIFFKKQIVLVTVGVGVMIFVSFFNYRYLKNYSFPTLLFYIAVVVLLVWALAFHSIRGSRAWISLWGFMFEPSELMKLAFIAVMAKYFSQRHVHIRQLRHIIASGVYLALPLGIILMQPDFGSGVLLMLIWGGMLLTAGMHRQHVIILALIGIVCAVSVWMFALKPYQKERLMAFVDPHQDPMGIGYNIIQSRIALGSGHWLGMGLGKGTQATLGFLPEAHNDFAYAAFGEQFGVIGNMLLLGLIATIILRILAIGRSSIHNFGKLFCVGLAIMIMVHVFTNAAVNSGILPITGIPFSFLSYGGSHLMSLMLGVGIVQSIQRNH
jgi:rod shape determining protein RodA